MNRAVLIALTLGVAILAPCPGSAREQPSPSASSPAREVSPRDLMTAGERYELRQKMWAAQTPQERFDLWAQKYAELQKRAAEKGVVLRDYGPMMMGHGTYDERGRRWWGGESHMMGPCGCGMHVRPPMGL